MMNDTETTQQETDTGMDTSPTAHIKQRVVATGLAFECMECGIPLDFEYLSGPFTNDLRMSSKEYHQLDVCEGDGEWSGRILVSIEVRA